MGCIPSKPPAEPNSAPTQAVVATNQPQAGSSRRVQFENAPKRSGTFSRLSMSLGGTGVDVIKVEGVASRPSKQGGFAEIYQGTYKNQLVAVKALRAVDTDNAPVTSIQTQDRLGKRMRREMKVWMSASPHPRIVTCIGYTIHNDSPALVSPWCKNGNIEEYLADTQPPDDVRKKLVAQVAEGLVHLHSRQIIHLDVKKANILIDDEGGARLTDFGVARVIDEFRTGLTTSGKSAITLKYSAPEAIEGDDRNLKSDVYSFGIFTLELLSKEQVWKGMSKDLDIIKTKADGLVPLPENHLHLPEDDFLWPLLRKCWQKDPEARPTMAQVFEDLRKHGFEPN